jgi:hypothetical protein
VLASLDAAFNNSKTRMQVVYRYSSAFSSDEGGRVPVPGSRFDVQMHQALPYHPAGNGRVELIFAVRTLFRDAHSGASFYDELLTVRPPTRFMGGTGAVLRGLRSSSASGPSFTWCCLRQWPEPGGLAVINMASKGAPEDGVLWSQNGANVLAWR